MHLLLHPCVDGVDLAEDLMWMKNLLDNNESHHSRWYTHLLVLRCFRDTWSETHCRWSVEGKSRSVIHSDWDVAYKGKTFYGIYRCKVHHFHTRSLSLRFHDGLGLKHVALIGLNLYPLILSARSPREPPNYIHNLVRDSIRARRQTSTALTRVTQNGAAQVTAVRCYTTILAVYFDIDFWPGVFTYISAVWNCAHQLAFIFCSHWKLQDGNAHSTKALFRTLTRCSVSGWNRCSYVCFDCLLIHS